MRPRGFTLMELLISLVLIALIASLLSGSLRLSTRSWDAGEQKAESAADMRLALHFLGAQLAQHQPSRLRRKPEQPLFFGGDRESLQFIGVLPARAGGGVFALRLSVRQDGEKRRLVIERVIPGGALSDDVTFADAEVSVLAEDVRELRLDYFGRDDDLGEPRWRESWNDRQRLPSLLRVAVIPARGEAWPALVVEPRLSIEAGCYAWNPAQQRCVGP